MALGAKTVSAAFQPGYFGDDTMIFKAILMCLLDYLLAYTMMGLGGIFRDKIKNPGTSLMCGSLVALGARYLSHILSGYLLFSGWADWWRASAPSRWAGSIPLCTTASTWFPS